MYAVIKTGGKQYRVAKNDVIVVERLTGAAGDEIELDQVLMVDDGKGPTLGTPLVDGACVAATVLDQSRGDKIIVFKKKRRKKYRRTMGHRQDLTVLRITDILAKGKKAGTSRARAEDDAPAADAADEAAVEEAVTATEAPAADEAPKPAAQKRASRAKRADAEAPAEESAKQAAPKRKRAAKPKAAKDPETAKDDAGGAGEAEENS